VAASTPTKPGLEIGMKTWRKRKNGRRSFICRGKKFVYEENKLAVNKTQQKYAKGMKRVPHTYTEDGYLRFGDKVMMLNKKTEGYLVFDMGDKIITHDEAYANTTSKKASTPCARNIFVLAKAEDTEEEYEDDIIRYGQKIRIMANKFITGKNLYLHSCQISPL
jgi:hypothetical protein